MFYYNDYNRSFVWDDEEQIVNNLGVELYRAGKQSEAKPHFVRSTELAPLWWTNWNNLGVILEDEGDTDDALAAYKKAIDQGHYYLAYENYARLLVKTRRYDEARAFLADSRKYLPGNAVLQELERVVGE